MWQAGHHEFCRGRYPDAVKRRKQRLACKTPAAVMTIASWSSLKASMELSLPAQGGHQIIAHRAVDFDGAEVAVKLEAFEGGDKCRRGSCPGRGFRARSGQRRWRDNRWCCGPSRWPPACCNRPAVHPRQAGLGPTQEPSVPFFGAAAGRTGNDLENIVFSMLFCGHYDRPDPRPLWGVGRTLRSGVTFAVRSKLRWLRAPATTFTELR